MTADSLTLVDLTSPLERAALARATYEEVLRPSFTLEELAGPEDVEPSGSRILTVVADEADAPLGAAVTTVGRGGISLLSYLAVSPAARGLGVGGALLGHLTGLWERAGCGLVLAEVHDPRGHAEAPDEHPEARLRFYERAGARVLDVPFIQPALGPGLARVRDMLLLAMHPAGAEEVEAAALARWIEQYYAASEGAVPTDPQAHALLARVMARPEIAVWPLSRWGDVDPLAG